MDPRPLRTAITRLTLPQLGRPEGQVDESHRDTEYDRVEPVA